jgi:hypothetical protein
MLIMMTPGILDPAGIAEVDGFEQDPKTLHHNDMQRWCRLAPTQPLRRPREREKRERWRGRCTRKEKRAPRARGIV